MTQPIDPGDTAKLEVLLINANELDDMSQEEIQAMLDRVCGKVPTGK